MSGKNLPTKVGSIEKSDGKTMINREWFRQGYIFKDHEAYANSLTEPCYVPELSDAVYCKKDFIEMCHGNEEIAEIIFDIVDWQSPETELDQLMRNGEILVLQGSRMVLNTMR